MHTMRTMLFGPHSLIEYIKFKNSLWVSIRRSYRQLQLYQTLLENFLKEPASSSTFKRAANLFRDIACHWGIIKAAKREFEETLHEYRLTIPSDLEMALYQEYWLFGNKIMDSCIASFNKAGINCRKFYHIDIN